MQLLRVLVTLWDSACDFRNMAAICRLLLQRWSSFWPCVCKPLLFPPQQQRQFNTEQKQALLKAQAAACRILTCELRFSGKCTHTHTYMHTFSLRTCSRGFFGVSAFKWHDGPAHQHGRDARLAGVLGRPERRVEVPMAFPGRADQHGSRPVPTLPPSRACRFDIVAASGFSRTGRCCWKRCFCTARACS